MATEIEHIEIDKLFRYFDNDLSIEENSAIQPHLKECLICKEALSEIKTFENNLSDISVPKAPFQIELKVLSKIELLIKKQKQDALVFKAITSLFGLLLLAICGVMVYISIHSASDGANTQVIAEKLKLLKDSSVKISEIISKFNNLAIISAVMVLFFFISLFFLLEKKKEAGKIINH